MKRNVRGFTLVEILIVVIILGILAAIVIPQFTNASTDAKKSAVASTLQSLRGAIELYKINNNDTPPTALTVLTTTAGKGPYLAVPPVNPATGDTTGLNYSVSGTSYTLTVTGFTGL